MHERDARADGGAVPVLEGPLHEPRPLHVPLDDPAAAVPRRVQLRLLDGPARRAGVPLRAAGGQDHSSSAATTGTPSLGGLLAGERLLLDLQALERKYLETDYRQLEIEQSFSLAQFDPAALAALRETGECTFKVPELFFDLAYPGHYRRRIKAVRLTLPCVVGPYANASATLKQLDSELRLEPTANPDPRRRRATRSRSPRAAPRTTAACSSSTSATSATCRSRAAARSAPGSCRCPKAFRPFDYGTISDVVLRISYTAESDETLRQTVDDALGTVASALGQRLKTDGLPLLLSLRRDLPDVWRKLVTTPAGTDVAFTIDERHLPVLIAGWLGGRALRDTTPAKKPKVSVETKSILLDASEKPGAGFGLTAKAGDREREHAWLRATAGRTGSSRRPSRRP